MDRIVWSVWRLWVSTRAMNHREIKTKSDTFVLACVQEPRNRAALDSLAGKTGSRPGVLTGTLTWLHVFLFKDSQPLGTRSKDGDAKGTGEKENRNSPGSCLFHAPELSKISDSFLASLQNPRHIIFLG